MTAIDLAFRLSSGKPWLDFNTHMSTVLVIQLEIPKAEYQLRVNKYAFGNKLNPADNLHFMTIRSLKLDKGWGIELLRQWIDYTHAQVVIVDPVFKVVSGRLTDEYDVRQFEDRLDEVIESHRVSFILVHHEGKDWVIDGVRYDRGADASFGSVFFGAWIDTQVELRAESEGSNRVDIRFPLLRLAEDDIPDMKIQVNRSNLVTSIIHRDKKEVYDET